jgi:hypothetical protein
VSEESQNQPLKPDAQTAALRLAVWALLSGMSLGFRNVSTHWTDVTQVAVLNDEGHTPLQVAEHAGSEQIVAYFSGA